MSCKHQDFGITVNIEFLEDAGRYMAEITIKCNQCNTPFRFIGLPAGLDVNGAAVGPDATEGRFAIAPKGEVVSVLEGAPMGFTIRKVGPPELLEPLKDLIAFTAVMFGHGPDAIIPEYVDTPIGESAKLGKIMREARAAVTNAEKGGG